MTVFSPRKAFDVAVNSALPRLVRGKSGRDMIGTEVMFLELTGCCLSFDLVGEGAT
jgi:hypothetical protein